MSQTHPSAPSQDGDRLLRLSGVWNFRDYGGYAAAGGRLLRRGLLYRSAQHGDAEASDLQTIGGLGLRAVIDLRDDGERRAAPCRRPEGFAARVVFAPGERTNPARLLEDADATRAYLLRAYRGMPHHPRIVESFRLYFETLEAEDGPTLVHCAAGKDRTGLAVALLHAALGVSEDDRMADYLLTNSADDADHRVARISERIAQRNGHVPPPASLRVLLSVEPDYLRAAFQAIQDEDGGLEAYLERRLGVTGPRLERLAGRLTG